MTPSEDSAELTPSSTDGPPSVDTTSSADRPASTTSPDNADGQVSSADAATDASPEPAAASKSQWNWANITAGAALVAMAVAVYAPALSAAYIWDDDYYVTNNLTLRSVDGLRRIWFELGAVPQYYPLVHTTFWLEYHLWNLAPLGYHVVNILLHAASAVLLWRLLTRLHAPGAWLAAALFAVHPVEVESVAWVTERKNVLSLMLALASMLSYLRFAPAEERVANETPSSTRWKWYALALILFAGAMLSKTVVASLPAVLVVIYWWKRGRLAARDLAPLAPFFAVGAGLGLLTVWMEKYHVGAVGEIFESTPVERLLIAGRALWFYAAKLAWPYPLTFFYPRWTIDASAGWQYLFPAAAVALPVALWLARGRIGRGPLAAVLIFAGVLFPALGFFNVYPFRFSYVADHFQYHASLALITLAAATVALAAARWLPDRKPAAQVAVAIPLLLLGALTFQRVRVFQNSEILFRDTIASNPQGLVAYVNLELSLYAQGKYEEALAVARDALALESVASDVDDPVTRSNLALAHGNLGTCLLRIGHRDGFQPGQFDEAIAEEREALRLDPRLITAYRTLGSAMAVANRPDEALAEYDRGLEIDPRDPETLYGKGRVLGALGRRADAAACFALALEKNPEFARARYDLALMLIDLGQVDEGAAQLQAALQIEPTMADAYYALGNLLSSRGNYQGAAHHYMAAIRLQPNFPQALNNLGVMRMSLGETDLAIANFQEAVRLSPEFADAKANLERALTLKRSQPPLPRP